MLDSIGGKFKDYTPLMIRLGLSVMMIILGAQLLSQHIGKSQVGELLVAGAYILGGLFALIGLMTRWAAAMLVVVLFIRIVNGPRLDAITEASSQYLFAALMMSLALFCAGGGEMSVDLKQKRKQDK